MTLTIDNQQQTGVTISDVFIPEIGKHFSVSIPPGKSQDIVLKGIDTCHVKVSYNFPNLPETIEKQRASPVTGDNCTVTLADINQNQDPILI